MHEKEVGDGGEWRKTWQNEEISGRKRRKAERYLYAGHRVKQMEKKVRSRRSTESNGRWGSDQDGLQGDEQCYGGWSVEGLEK